MDQAGGWGGRVEMGAEGGGRSLGTNGKEPRGQKPGQEVGEGQRGTVACNQGGGPVEGGQRKGRGQDWKRSMEEKGPGAGANGCQHGMHNGRRDGADGEQSVRVMEHGMQPRLCLDRGHKEGPCGAWGGQR